MSADLNTEIEMEGTLEEIKSALAVIKSFCTNEHKAMLYSPIISLTKPVTFKSTFSLEYKTDEALNDFLKIFKNKIFVEAGGPYGRYGEVPEAGLFEALAEAVPNAKVKAKTSGFTTGQNDVFRAELKDGTLKLTYYYLPDDSRNYEKRVDNIEKWKIETDTTYDPVKKKYDWEDKEQEYIFAMAKRMPFSEFKKLFGLTNTEMVESEYREYIYDCYCAWSFPVLDYDDFKYAFPSAEISEDEFNETVKKAIKKYKLVTFEKYSKNKRK